jgi:rare lipoprotein A
LFSVSVRIGGPVTCTGKAAAVRTRGFRPLLAPYGMLLMVVFLFGCGSSARQPASPADAAAVPTVRGYKVGKPYLIRGMWYYPAVDYGYDEMGIASWYGPGFDGRATANGETYDMNELTAAHRTLPLPSVVRVTNLENGRSIKLRVNDRGPFVGDRIIDVSRRAAQLLGFYTDGTARVRVEIVADESQQLAAALGVPDVYAAERPAAQPAAVEVAFSNDVQSPSLPDPNNGQASIAPAAVSDTDAALSPTQPEAGHLPTDYTTASNGGEPTAVQPDIDQRTAGTVPEVTAALEAPPAETSLAMATSAGEPNPRYDFRSGSRMYVQAGAFADVDRADLARRRLLPIGPIVMSTSRSKGRDLLRVRVGPLRSDEAERVLASVTRAGFPDCRLVTE